MPPQTQTGIELDTAPDIALPLQSAKAPPAPLRVMANCTAVLGNIGVGKSTSLRRLRALLPGHEFFEEDFVAAHADLLANFYADPPRYIMQLQETIQGEHEARLALRDSQESPPPWVIERTVWCSLEVFARVSLESGVLQAADFEKLHRRVAANNIVPSRIVYLRLDPEECRKRVMRRSRGGEEDIPLEYLRALHDKYERLVEWFRGVDGVSVHTVDAGMDKEAVATAMTALVQ